MIIVSTGVSAISSMTTGGQEFHYEIHTPLLPVKRRGVSNIKSSKITEQVVLANRPITGLQR